MNPDTPTLRNSLTFSSPVPFQEALDSLRSKGLLPTSLSSEELSKLPAEIRQRALFSARTTNAGYLQRIKDLTDQLLHPGFVREPGLPGETSSLRESKPGEYMDPATMRLKLKEALRAISYDPIKEGIEPGTLKDLSSDTRLNLIIQMQSDSAWGYGAFIRGQDPAALSAAPAQELFRAEARKEPRNWPQRWMKAGGEFYDGGRMIALKNDPIWTDISAFDQPYPPFDYGSGMWVRDIFRPEAIQLGLIDPGEDGPEPIKIPSFNEGLQTSLTGLDADLQQAVLESIGSAAEFISGVLHLKNSLICHSRGNGNPVLTIANYDANPNRDQLGRFTFKESLSAIQRIVQAGKTKSDKSAEIYGDVTDRLATRIKDATGHDVSGRQHHISADAVRHALKGRPEMEKYFPLIPHILLHPDSIAGGTTRRPVLPAVVYTKKFDREVVMVEEILRKKKYLSLKTLKKK